jgi:hypothetical protein
MNMKRMRGRNHRPNGGGGGNNGGGGFRNQQNGIPLNRNHVFDSSGPEMRVRGTAQQLYEKYQQLARDASSNGDRVTGEAYYQHAEHYFRIISAINQAQGQPNGPVNPAQGPHPSQGQPHAQNGQQPYQNPNQGNGQNFNQDRNGNQAEPQNGQQNGHYNNQNRRYDQNNAERQQDLQLNESAPQAEQRHESRPVEPRQYEPRPQEPRRFEARKPEFQRNDRNNDRGERFRPETPVVDTRIDISSALEAELAAAVAEPPAPPPVLEARAIPIIPDAPPQSDPAPVAEAPARVAKPRGRPRAVKAAPKEE